MFVIDVSILVLFILGASFIISQIIVPALMGKRLFPDLRKNVLKDEVAQLKEEIEVLTEKKILTKQLDELNQTKQELN